MAKPKGGLTKWFKEDWRDVKTGEKCGRSGKEKKKELNLDGKLKPEEGRIAKKKEGKRKDLRK